MTLAAFTPETLDELSLRIFDIAAMVRQMANRGREHDLPSITLHRAKLTEWLKHMEDWVQEGSVKLETSLIRQRGAMRAQNSLAAKGKRGRGRPKKSK